MQFYYYKKKTLTINAIHIFFLLSKSIDIFVALLGLTLSVYLPFFFIESLPLNNAFSCKFLLLLLFLYYCHCRYLLLFFSIVISLVLTYRTELEKN